MKIEKYVDMYLGMKVKDKVTNFVGIVTCVSFDLYGCIQVVIQPMSKNNELRDSKWFDLNRLTVLSKKPVMSAPDFENGYQADAKQGCAEKPIR